MWNRPLVINDPKYAFKYRELMTKIEDVVAHKTRSPLGHEVCKICGKKIGEDIYYIDYNGVAYVWPSGYKHYLTAHNVKPSASFLVSLVYAKKHILPKFEQHKTTQQKVDELAENCRVLIHESWVVKHAFSK